MSLAKIFLGADIQEVLGTTIALNIMFGLPLWAGVILTITSTFLILLVKQCGMRKLEMVFFLLIGSMSVCFFINLGIIGLNARAFAFGLVVPTCARSSVYALVGLIGAVLMPQNLYLHSTLMNEEEKVIENRAPASLNEGITYNAIETAISLILR